MAFSSEQRVTLLNHTVANRSPFLFTHTRRRKNGVRKKCLSHCVCDELVLTTFFFLFSFLLRFSAKGGRKVFRDFLKCEYSEENILFWLACEELKNESKADLVEEKVRGIYEDYISILSPKEVSNCNPNAPKLNPTFHPIQVSLDSRVRDVINKNMVKPNKETFDEAQLQIYTLMHRDSYPRFINSPNFRKLAQLPTPSRKASVA